MPPEYPELLVSGSMYGPQPLSCASDLKCNLLPDLRQSLLVQPFDQITDFFFFCYKYSRSIKTFNKLSCDFMFCPTRRFSFPL